MPQKLKPGVPAPFSGIYDIIGSRGGDTGVQRVAEKDEPLPPTPGVNQTYKLAKKAKH